MNVKITAPYPRFRIAHIKFNVSGQRYCSPEDIEFLKKVDPNIGIFKDDNGVELNPKPIIDEEPIEKVKPKTVKPKIKKEAPDAHKDTEHSDS